MITADTILNLSVKYYIAQHEVYGTAVKRNLFDGDKTRYFHIFYDDARAANERNVFLKRLKIMEETLDSQLCP